MAIKREVGHCELCGIQWVINGASDRKRCPFCGAPEEAIWIEDETNRQADD
jgi:hypothetical protein